MQYFPLQILEEIERDMAGHAIAASIKALPGDRWLSASAMQKCIRRSETETALRAAVTVWQQDRRSFWRRAHTTAVEDIGIASVDTVVKVLTAHEAPAWRRRMGDLRVGLYLVKQMCDAPKSRAGDQTYTICDRAPDLNNLRQELSHSHEETLSDFVLNDCLPLEQRLLSLWLIAGTRRLPSENLPQREGIPELAIEVLRSMEAPAALTESCIAVLFRTQWPLALFQPLLWREFQKQCPAIINETLPVSPDVEGIPLYGADQYTRIGKACLREFQRTVPSLRQFSTKQLGTGLFYIEGEKTDQTLTSQALDNYRQAGEMADLESTGLHQAECIGLKQCMIENVEILHDIRQRQLRRYLEGGAEWAT